MLHFFLSILQASMIQTFSVGSWKSRPASQYIITDINHKLWPNLL